MSLTPMSGVDRDVAAFQLCEQLFERLPKLVCDQDVVLKTVFAAELLHIEVR
jgi:hypothetical protein